MRSSDGVAWFLASAMLLLTLAGCGVFGLGALVLPFDRLRDRDQSMERVVVVTATAAAPTSTVMAPTVPAPTAVVVVEVAPTAVVGSGLVLLPLVVGPAVATVTPWATAVVTVATPDLMGCVCSADVYNCDDGEIAVRCYGVCMAQGLGDVHGLDGYDNDGKACE